MVSGVKTTTIRLFLNEMKKKIFDCETHTWPRDLNFASDSLRLCNILSIEDDNRRSVSSFLLAFELYKIEAFATNTKL